MKRKYGFIVGVSALAGSLSMVPCVFAQTGAPAADTNSAATMKGEMDDTVIMAKAKAALSGDKDTSSAVDAIKVQSNGGVVTLTGGVPTQAAAEHAQMVVARLSGVRDVVNDLKYPPAAGGMNSTPNVVPPAAANDSTTTTTSASSTTTTKSPADNSTSAGTTNPPSTVPN